MGKVEVQKKFTNTSVKTLRDMFSSEAGKQLEGGPKECGIDQIPPPPVRPVIRSERKTYVTGVKSSREKLKLETQGLTPKLEGNAYSGHTVEIARIPNLDR